MTVWFKSHLIAGAALLVLLFASVPPLWAQERSGPAIRTAGTTVNLFETLDPSRPIDGVRLTVPGAWEVKEVRLLRYGTEPVPTKLQKADTDGRYFVSHPRPVRGPHELIVRVRLADTPGTYTWNYRPYVRETASPDSIVRRSIREAEGNQGVIEVKSGASPNATNTALSLAEATGPLLLRADGLPPLGRGSSFTIEFWVQTNGLDEIVLSTWNGMESVSYPAEFTIDQSGRLRFYHGKAGEHRALRSGEPIADGKWHHVATVYDASDARLRLLVDGAVADSMDGHPPQSTGPRPMAVGGRLEGEGSAEEEKLGSLFAGTLDEVRVWSEARSVRRLRRMRTQPFQTHVETAAARVVRLGFDEEEPTVVQQWPEGARRVPVSLSFRSSLRNLRAHAEDGSVTLQWAASDMNIDAFIVERSTDGRSFSRVAELSPSRAKRASASAEFLYTDEEVPEQLVYYRIRLRGKEGTERTSGTIKIGLGATDEKEKEVQLVGNFPNPFSETTTVAFDVREARPVTVTVWDLAGHRLALLADGTKEPGYHEVSFEATDLPSGTYFVRLETPTETQSHRMVLLK